MAHHFARSLICASFLATAPLVHAEKADRDKPINVEANSLKVDDERHIQILEGDVVLTQGTLYLRADKLVVTEDQQGFQRGVATGGPKGKSYFRQKREGRKDYVEGEAERIEYDSRSEVAEFFQRAEVRTGQDIVRGDYIWYDAMSEKYRVNSQANPEQPNPSGRVRAVIQPRDKANDITAPVDGLSLQSSKSVQPPAR